MNNSQDAKPERDELLKLIDSELQAIATQTARSGATQWGVMAAIGALLWAFVDTLKAGLPPLHALACALVVVTIGKDVLRGAYVALSGEPRSKASTRFGPIITSSSRPMVAWAALSCFLVAAAAYVTPGVAVWPRVVVVGMYGGIALMLVIMIAMSLAGAVVPRGNSRIEGAGPPLVGAAIIALATGGYYFARSLTLDWLSLKVALLLIAIQWVVSKLLAHSTTEELEQSLKSARRDLIIGRSSEEDIAARVDVALLGLRASDVLADEAVAHARAMESTEQSLRVVRDALAVTAEAVCRLDLAGARAAEAEFDKAVEETTLAIERETKTLGALSDKVLRLASRTWVNETRQALLSEAEAAFAQSRAASARLKSTMVDLHEAADKMHTDLAAAIERESEQ